MSNFVEVEQDGGRAFVNADQIAIASPSKIIGRTGLIFVNGTISLEIKGTVQEFVDKTNGKDPQKFSL